MLKRPPEEREKWLEAVKTEFDNCEAREVWTRIKKKDVPKGRRLIGSKWVFKRKRDGRYRSRLVALGYTQIPGVDFTDNFSPVISDVTLRICLTIWLILDLDIDQMDVETAFLEGILAPNEYMYMLNPEGMNLDPDECLEIRKGLYGLVQSSRVFFLKFSRYLVEQCDFTRCDFDQCLFYKIGKKGIIILLLYVDDSAIFGYRDDIDETFNLIRRQFKITTEGKLNDFLGCDILRHAEEPVSYLLQPHLIKKIRKSFGTIKQMNKKYNTPGSPRQILRRVKPEEDNALNKKTQTLYQSGVGSLLYLLKHSRPELSNPIRELTKCMTGANQHALKEMYRVISWVLRHQDIGLKMAPQWAKDDQGKVKWYLTGICDSTWGSDPDDGRSVSGYILYFMGVPISWRSKTQSHVTCSSAEAEFVSASELVKEIKFVIGILEHLGIEVELPVKVYIDNIGAIYMARNNIRTGATRHVNYRFHYCREVHDKLIIFVFVRSEDNEADILTKNATREEMDKHAPKLVDKIPNELLTSLDMKTYNTDEEDEVYDIEELTQVCGNQIQNS